MKRFVIHTDVLPKSEADTITLVVRDIGSAYWHWIEGVWLVQTSKDYTAKSLYEVIIERVPSLDKKTVLVLEIEGPRTYWGCANKDGWEWMKSLGWGEPD